MMNFWLTYHVQPFFRKFLETILLRIRRIPGYGQKSCSRQQHRHVTGKQGYRDTRPSVWFSEQKSPTKTRTIFSWGYGDTRDTKNTRVSQKNETHFFIGIQGYRDTRHSVGGTGRKSEPRKTKQLENHGDTGIRGIRRIRAPPRKTRHIFSWGYGDTRDTRISQKTQTHFFIGIRGYRDTRPSVGGTGRKSEPRKTKQV